MKCSEGVVRDFVLISWTKNTDDRGFGERKWVNLLVWNNLKPSSHFFNRISVFSVCVQTNFIFFTGALRSFLSCLRAKWGGDRRTNGSCQVSNCLFCSALTRLGRKVSNMIALSESMPAIKKLFYESRSPNNFSLLFCPVTSHTHDIPAPNLRNLLSKNSTIGI